MPMSTIAATTPSQRPHDARLLVVDERGALHYAARSALTDHLHPGDLLVANDAATLPASLAGVHRPTGEPIEVRLVGRRSLAPDDVREVTAVVFGAGSRLRVVDAVLTGVHEPGESHYELLRAFTSDAVLRRMSAALETNAFRSHEFGDSVLVAQAMLRPS